MLQDYILTLCNFVFIFALLPSVFSQNKPAFSTSLVTASALFVMTITFATLALWLTAAASSVSCFLWFVLAFQSFSKRKRVQE
jgi:hypothetical protein